MCRSLIIMAVLATSACQGGRDDSGSAPAADAVTARFEPAAGEPLALRVTDSTAGDCAVRIGDRELSVRATAEALTLSDGDQVQVVARRQDSGLAVEVDGQPAARVPAPTASAPLSVIDAIGVPMFRVRLDGADLVVRDAAGMPTLLLAPTSPSAFAARRPSDQEQVGTAWTGDGIVAALLATDAADPRIRTLLACERLLAVAR